MKRIVQPELLDTLPPGDERAMRSRRDLRRVNALMGNKAIMTRALKQAWSGPSPRHIVELGSGDGSFLLSVAEKIAPAWPEAEVLLLDLQKTIAAKTLTAFGGIGWQAESVTANVFDWPKPDSDVVVSNLFLHHFECARLSALLCQISENTKLFVALEPRRGRWPLFCSRLLWAIGCNEVTQHDAEISVRAGFTGTELTGLWPVKRGWTLTERPAGAFGHLFIARSID